MVQATKAENAVESPGIGQIMCYTVFHQQPITATSISLLILAAKRLAEALQDPVRTSQLKDLHIDIQNKIQAMELNKNALEDNHTHELRAMQLQ